MDIGIKLVDKLCEDVRDIDQIVSVINEVIEDHGYRVRWWAEWDKFRHGCVLETEFLKDFEAHYREIFDEDGF